MTLYIVYGFFSITIIIKRIIMDEVNALVVDDDESARLILSAMLSSSGFEPIVASSADEALEIISKTNINLILCDWEMPGTSGLELCHKIRESDSGRYTYFILVSGRTEQHSIVSGLQAGADDFICKLSISMSLRYD